MSHYFDEESKEWKPLKSVPIVGEVVKKWSSVKCIGNCLYLACSDAGKSDIYRYDVMKNIWEKLTKSSFPKIIQCLCCVGDFVHPRFTVWLTKPGDRVGTICIYLHKKS